MTSSYDITAMIITPLISYIGGSRKKPLFCAWGLFTMGVGFFIFMLPHFVSPPYQATGRWIRLTFTQFATKSWTLLRSCLPSFSIPCCFFALFLLYKTFLDMLPAFFAASSSPFLSEALCRTCALCTPSLPTNDYTIMRPICLHDFGQNSAILYLSP